MEFHLIGASLLVAGAFLEQLALFRKEFQNAQAKNCTSNRPTLLLVFTCGMCLELFSCMLLPLSTYILLGSVHLVFFKVNLLDSKSKTEVIGFWAIALGCLTVLFTGGVQTRDLESQDLDEILNGDYFMWMFGSLLLNLSLRKLGFYQGLPMIEVSLPGQIGAFGYGCIKVCFYSLEMYISSMPLSISLLLWCTVIGLVFLSASSAFVRLLSKKHNLVVVLGGYSIWSIVCGLPLALFIVKAGVHYTPGNYASILISACLIIGGIIPHTHYKAPPKEFELKPQKNPAPLPEEPELMIEDENLIDTEVIDEDSLIKNIRNI